MELELERDVPIPESNRVNWPHKDMQVGESFLCTNKTLAAVCNVNVRYAKKHNMKYTAKQMEDGVRVWRIA